jgi:mannitol/fructose-specific phosphotransferase system IIA component (Ntr-type)
MKLSEIIVRDAILPDLGQIDRDEAITRLVDSLVAAGVISKRSAKDVAAAVIERENQATTGLGKGVALPHAKVGTIKRVVGAIGRSSAGIEFKALDSRPVHILILLLSNPDRPDEHLQAMGAVYRHVNRKIFRRFLRQSETVEAIADLIDEADDLAVDGEG